MVQRIQYVNKITREVSPTLEQWIESLSDPLDKETSLSVYASEAQRADNDPPAGEYIELFVRYMNECNIEIVSTYE